MATKDTTTTKAPGADEVNTPAKVIAQAKARQRAELEQRKASIVILSPEDVGGRYDAGRALQTVLNGQRRDITGEDLKRFAKLTKELGKAFAGGITARQIIDMAQPERRARANTQIHFAVPMEIRGARMHFTTNAAPGSRAVRHNVWVEFVELGAVTASPAKVEVLAKRLAAGRIKVDCDCEDWRFVFRYLATVGDFNAGRPETGFPKLRNPQLEGVACKHILRTVHLLSAPVAQRKLIQMIELARGKLDKAAVKRVLKREAEDMAREQAGRKDWQRSQIETTAERKERLAATKAVKAVAAKPEAGAIPSGATDAEVAAAFRRARAGFDELVRIGKMTRAGVDDILRANGWKGGA